MKIGIKASVSAACAPITVNCGRSTLAAFNRVLTFDEYEFQKSTEEKARNEIMKLQPPG